MEALQVLHSVCLVIVIKARRRTISAKSLCHLTWTSRPAGSYLFLYELLEDCMFHISRSFSLCFLACNCFFVRFVSSWQKFKLMPPCFVLYHWHRHNVLVRFHCYVLRKPIMSMKYTTWIVLGVLNPEGCSTIILSIREHLIFCCRPEIHCS